MRRLPSPRQRVVAVVAEREAARAVPVDPGAAEAELAEVPAAVAGEHV
jgi:hypothetical protein